MIQHRLGALAGEETGTLSPLQAVADCLESEAWRCLLRQTLAQGLSFPVARQRAATALLGENAQCLRHPNNNLGIEYLRALRSLGSPLVPHTIPRLGAGHDQGQTAASMWAMMPMFLVFSRVTLRAILLFPPDYQRKCANALLDSAILWTSSRFFTALPRLLAASISSAARRSFMVRSLRLRA